MIPQVSSMNKYFYLDRYRQKFIVDMRTGYSYWITTPNNITFRLTQKDIFGNTAFTDFNVILLPYPYYGTSSCYTDQTLRAKGFALDVQYILGTYLSHQIHIQAPVGVDQNECMAKPTSSLVTLGKYHSMDARLVDKLTGVWSPLPQFMRLDFKT